MYDIFVAEQLVSLNVDNQREKFHRLWMKTFMCINPERCSAADAKSEYLFRQRGDSFVVFSTIKAQKQLLSDLERIAWILQGKDHKVPEFTGKNNCRNIEASIKLFSLKEDSMSKLKSE